MTNYIYAPWTPEQEAQAIRWRKRGMTYAEVALAAEKDGLIAIAPEIAAGIAAELNKALLATIKAKLEMSWERKKIFEALFT